MICKNTFAPQIEHNVPWLLNHNPGTETVEALFAIWSDLEWKKLCSEKKKEKILGEKKQGMWANKYTPNKSTNICMNCVYNLNLFSFEGGYHRTRHRCLVPPYQSPLYPCGQRDVWYHRTRHPFVHVDKGMSGTTVPDIPLSMWTKGCLVPSYQTPLCPCGQRDVWYHRTRHPLSMWTKGCLVPSYQTPLYPCGQRDVWYHRTRHPFIHVDKGMSGTMVPDTPLSMWTKGRGVWYHRSRHPFIHVDKGVSGTIVPDMDSYFVAQYIYHSPFKKTNKNNNKKQGWCGHGKPGKKGNLNDWFPGWEKSWKSLKIPKSWKSHEKWKYIIKTWHSGPT